MARAFGEAYRAAWDDAMGSDVPVKFMLLIGSHILLSLAGLAALVGVFGWWGVVSVPVAIVGGGAWLVVRQILAQSGTCRKSKS